MNAGEAGGQSIDERLRIIAQPIRFQILMALNDNGVGSPSQLRKELKQPLNLVDYHCKVLEEAGFIELQGTKQRRGATEHFYRPTQRPILTDEDWAQLPQSVRPEVSVSVLQMVWRDVKESIRSRMFDKPDTRHLSRTSLLVDEKGWSDLTDLLNATLARGMEIQGEASRRLAAGGEEAIASKMVLMHFRSPQGEERQA